MIDMLWPLASDPALAAAVVGATRLFKAALALPAHRVCEPHQRGAGPRLSTYRAETHSFRVGGRAYQILFPATVVPRTLQTISRVWPFFTVPSLVDAVVG